MLQGGGGGGYQFRILTHQVQTKRRVYGYEDPITEHPANK